jgi:hypothetical protein
VQSSIDSARQNHFDDPVAIVAYCFIYFFTAGPFNPAGTPSLDAIVVALHRGQVQRKGVRAPKQGF